MCSPVALAQGGTGDENMPGLVRAQRQETAHVQL